MLIQLNSLKANGAEFANHKNNILFRKSSRFLPKYSQEERLKTLI